jgi:hypothetical protein
MVLKDIDSSKLLFDIHAKDLQEQFTKRFTEFEEYEGKVDSLKVIQYIILLSDMSSPMRVEKPDWYARKYTIAHMVKFPMSKKEFSTEAEAIIIGDDDIVNQTIVAYIASYGLPNYTLLMAFMSLMSFETQKIFAGKGSKDSQKIIDNASDRIQNLTRDFFKSGDTDEYFKARQALYAKVEQDKMRLRPEQIVRVLEDTGDLPEGFSPYGDDYKISLKDDLLFIGDK